MAAQLKSRQSAAVRTLNRRIWNVLRLGLGVLWIVDGFLQLKPPMLTSAFVQRILAGNLGGQPIFVRNLIHYGIGLWSVNFLASGILAALIKFTLGTLLVWPAASKQRIGIVHTMVWGLITWIFGEGFGMIFIPGAASFAAGAPGSVLFYVVIAALLYGGWNDWYARLRRVMGVLWAGAFAYQLAILLWAPSTSFVNTALSASTNPVANNIVVTIVFAVFLAFWSIGKLSRPIIVAAMVWWFILWGAVMGFGWGVMSTDPNSGPLWILLLIAQYMSLPRESTPSVPRTRPQAS